MKSRFTGCLLIAALLAGGPGCKTMTPPPPAKPTASHGGAEIRFAETEHDFGEVANGASLKYDFVFTNTGTNTLEVTDVSPECSCANTGDWSRKVEPGRSGTIPIRFNSTTLSGPIHKLVGVTCNSPIQAQTILNLKAIVWKAIEVDPASVSFTPQDEVKTVQIKIVRIVNHSKVPLELSPPECPHPAFTAELRTLRAGREFEARISASEPFGPGPVRGLVTIRTSSKLLPVISLTAVVLPGAAIEVMPPQFTLRPAPLAVATKAGVTLRKHGGTAITLSDAIVNVPGVAATIEETAPGHDFNVILEFPVGFKCGPGTPAELSV